LTGHDIVAKCLRRLCECVQENGLGCHSHYKPHTTEEPVRRVPQHRTVRSDDRNWAGRWKRQNANRNADERKRPHENSSTSCQREGVDVGPRVHGSAHRSDAERYLRETPDSRRKHNQSHAGVQTKHANRPPTPPTHRHTHTRTHTFIIFHWTASTQNTRKGLCLAREATSQSVSTS
jgi:hypothetical protein